MGAPVAVCPTCQGDRTDPNDPGNYDHAVHMHDPYSRGPCPTCNGTGVQDFGHRPLLINQNMCGGCEVCGTAEEQEVCARCFPVTYEPGWAWVLDPATGEMVSRFGRWPTYGTVPWPCASAVVLGLTPTT